MNDVITKRTADNRLIDIDCSLLLRSGQTIQAVQTPIAFSKPAAAADLTFGAPTINAQPITYPDGHIAPAGTVIQVLIGGGSAIGRGTEYVLRPRFTTPVAGELIEATTRLLVTDEP